MAHQGEAEGAGLTRRADTEAAAVEGTMRPAEQAAAPVTGRLTEPVDAVTGLVKAIGGIGDTVGGALPVHLPVGTHPGRPGDGGTPAHGRVPGGARPVPALFPSATARPRRSCSARRTAATHRTTRPPPHSRVPSPSRSGTPATTACRARARWARSRRPRTPRATATVPVAATSTPPLRRTPRASGCCPVASVRPMAPRRADGPKKSSNSPARADRSASETTCHAGVAQVCPLNLPNSKDITTMRSNIRRSIAVAATATGLWALGSVAANAAQLPATPDLPAVGTVTGAAQHLPTGAVTGTVQKAAGTATKTVRGAAGKATGVLGGGVSADKLPTGQLPQAGGIVDGVRQLVGGAGLPDANAGDVQKAVDGKQAKQAVKQLSKVAKTADLGKAGKLVNGKLPALPKLPAVPGVPAAKLPGGLPTGLPGVPALPKTRVCRRPGFGRQPAGRPRRCGPASRAADQAGAGCAGHRASGRRPHRRRRAAAGRRPDGRQGPAGRPGRGRQRGRARR
ncbi:hypothetical protein O1L44_12660 [Streptomyces noursei]|nr:hypothetical protein [Streptomyces noursei]